MKPGVHTIPAFDISYFKPGTMVSATIVLNDGSFGQTKIGLISSYENGRQAMRLFCPNTDADRCSRLEITIEDYMSGRVVIKRMVEEEKE